MKNVHTNRAALFFSLGVGAACGLGVMAACKSRAFHASSGTKEAQALPSPEPEPTQPPLDNRSLEGGARGTSDAFDGTDEVPRFSLKADYPNSPAFVTAPPPIPDVGAIRGSDAAAAKAAAKVWLDAVQKYIYEGMNDQDAGNPDRNFRLDDPKSASFARWFHMPWLHTPIADAAAPGRGREGAWGLTRELDMATTTDAGWPLVTGRGCTGTDWGVGFFNEPGGYAIGSVFPRGEAVFPEKATFPKGTVSFKILFTSVRPETLKSLEGAWTIHALVNGAGACGKSANGPRQLIEMRHVQMDVMMKYGDGPHDWIFGNYVYNKAARDRYWQGMEPLGVQTGVKQEETVVTAPVFRPNGWKNRLNGPADNPNASCLACHARAQWPELSPSRLPFAPKNAGDAAVACVLHEWGGEGVGAAACRPCGEGGCLPQGREPLLPGAVSLDYSMQFGLALRNRSVFAISR